MITTMMGIQLQFAFDENWFLIYSVTLGGDGRKWQSRLSACIRWMASAKKRAMFPNGPLIQYCVSLSQVRQDQANSFAYISKKRRFWGHGKAARQRGIWDF